MHELDPVVIVFIVLTLAFPILLIRFFVWLAREDKKKNTCEHCGNAYAFVEIERKEIGREPCSKIESLYTRNKKGEIIGSRDNRIYGEQIKYEVTTKCKACGYIKKSIKSEEKYP